MDRGSFETTNDQLQTYSGKLPADIETFCFLEHNYLFVPLSIDKAALLHESCRPPEVLKAFVQFFSKCGRGGGVVRQVLTLLSLS